jgi:hypothetical protein
MWPDCKSPPIDFFNYCKLFVQQREPSLADEIHLTEAFTRFFAGTIASLMWSLWITIAFAAINGGILIVAAVSKLKINSVKWKSSVVTPRIVYVGAILLLGVLLIVLWRQVIRYFRSVRLKEAETVYFAFYLASTKGTREDPQIETGTRAEMKSE